MTNEVEVKLMVVSEDSLFIDRFINKKGIKLLNDESVCLDNRYFDTAEQLLYKNGIALRVRNYNNSCEMTIKTKSGISGGLHIHPEYNISLDTSPKIPNIDLFPKEIFAAVDVEYIKQNLLENMSQKCLRHIFLIEYKNTIIEISFDTVNYKGKENIITSKELEFELKEGEVNTLLEFVLCFLDFVGSGIVRIGTLSKMHRAAIYAGISPVPAVKSAVTDTDTDLDLFKNFESWEINFLLAPSALSYEGLKVIISTLANSSNKYLGREFEKLSKKLHLLSDFNDGYKYLPIYLSEVDFVKARLNFNFNKAFEEGVVNE
jgi:inorganic triphosphatase YgiF